MNEILSNSYRDVICIFESSRTSVNSSFKITTRRSIHDVIVVKGFSVSVVKRGLVSINKDRILLCFAQVSKSHWLLI